MSFQELGSFFFCFGGECACKIQELDRVLFLKYSYTLCFKKKKTKNAKDANCLSQKSHLRTFSLIGVRRARSLEFRVRVWGVGVGFRDATRQE